MCEERIRKYMRCTAGTGTGTYLEDKFSPKLYIEGRMKGAGYEILQNIRGSKVN